MGDHPSPEIGTMQLAGGRSLHMIVQVDRLQTTARGVSGILEGSPLKARTVPPPWDKA